jgi:LysM repeat protein
MTEETVFFRKNVLIALGVSAGVVILALVVAYFISRPRGDEAQAPDTTVTPTLVQAVDQQPNRESSPEETGEASSPGEPAPDETTEAATSAIATAAPPTPTEESAAGEAPATLPTPTTATGPLTYTVKEGDVISGIAYEFGVSIDALRQANDLTGDLIRPGDVLVIPSESGEVSEPETTSVPEGVTIHEVQAGEVLGTIAKKYGVSVEDLMEANDLDNADMIREGQELVIPNQ